MEQRLYFAYGSNINLNQMMKRCPAAQAVGPVVLDNYELLFKSNASGNGVATIVPQEGQQVCGMLWRITPYCEASMDRYEGYPHLYGKKSINVQDKSGQSYTVMAYVMTEGEIWRDPAMPSTRYYQTILDGYRQNGLPLKQLDRALAHTREDVRKAMQNYGCQPKRTRTKQLILTSGKFSINLNGGGMSVAVSALETLKAIGAHYGIYDRFEDARDQQVVCLEKQSPALVLQRNTGDEESPRWETVDCLTRDPDEIKQYLAFREVLDIARQIELSHGPRTAPIDHPKDTPRKKKGKITCER